METLFSLTAGGGFSCLGTLSFSCFSFKKLPNPSEKFSQMGHSDTVSTLNKASITLSSFLLHRVANARIEKFIRNSALGDIVWVRPQKLAGEANRSLLVDYTSSITNRFGDLGKFLELWLEGMDGYASFSCTRHSLHKHKKEHP